MPRSTASTACTIWSTNSRPSRSMSVSSIPRSSATSPMISLRRRDSPCAEASGTKPTSSITARIRSRVSARTRSEPRITRDTVAVETPARRATSYTVGMNGSSRHGFVSGYIHLFGL